jgi:hypothetical protein
VRVLKGMHITRLPEQRAAILRGDLQRAQCAACGVGFRYEAQSIYTDFSRYEYVAVEPPQGGDWRALRAHHIGVFDRTFQMGPAVASDLAGGVCPRLVFGLGALREKLLCWDAGLDDRVLELCKASWCAREGVETSSTLLRLEAVLDGGHMMLAVLEPSVRVGDAGVFSLPKLKARAVIQKDQIEKLHRRQTTLIAEVPWLKEPWLVDLHDAHPDRG